MDAVSANKPNSKRSRFTAASTSTNKATRSNDTAVIDDGLSLLFQSSMSQFQYQPSFEDLGLPQSLMTRSPGVTDSFKARVQRGAEKLLTRQSGTSFTSCMFTLKDFNAMDTLENLLLKYGNAGHLGVRDPSYAFFINRAQNAALYYKVLGSVAVVSGDPLCPQRFFKPVIDEFRMLCKQKNWGIAIMGASDAMAQVAQDQHWSTVRTCKEKVLNPTTNPLLLGKSGKRTVSQCKKLLKSGLLVQLYSPSAKREPTLDVELVNIYQEWCNDRNTTRTTQAYVTVFDILSLPRIMTFVYVRDQSNHVMGFAALRRIRQGFHIDPYIAKPDAPKGTTDLLIYSTMVLCKSVGISHLSLGFEPLENLEDSDMVGLSRPLRRLTKAGYDHMYSQLPLAGKRTFYQRFHPDDDQEKGVYMIHLQTPGIRHMLAMVHYANISIRGVVRNRLAQRSRSRDSRKSERSRSSSDGFSSQNDAQSDLAKGVVE